MECPYCKWTKSTVVDTYRLTVEVVRIRRCDRCKNYWETVERIERKVSPKEKAEERIQMNLFEVTTSQSLRDSSPTSGEPRKGGKDDEED